VSCGRTMLRSSLPTKTAVVESILAAAGAPGPLAPARGLERRPPPDMERPRGTTRPREFRSCDRDRQRSLRPLRARQNHMSARQGGSRLPLHEDGAARAVCPPSVNIGPAAHGWCARGTPRRRMPAGVCIQRRQRRRNVWSSAVSLARRNKRRRKGLPSASWRVCSVAVVAWRKARRRPAPGPDRGPARSWSATSPGRWPGRGRSCDR